MPKCLNMNLRTGALIFIALCLGLGLWLWLVQPNDQLEAPVASVQVVVSVYPLADFTRRIGGEFVGVTSVVPSGVEPHDFEPSPRTVTQILDADALIYIGAGFDRWAEDAVPELEARDGVTLAVEDAVNLRQNFSSDSEASLDPHVWLDPVAAQDIVIAIRDLLSQIDPQQASVYTANAQVFLESLRELDAAYATTLSECERNDIIVSHNAFGYLGNRYDFNIHAISGLSPESEPSLNDLVELAAQAKELKIDTIFFETLVSPALAQTLAEEIGAKTAVLNPIEGLSPSEIAAGENYLSLMEQNRLALSDALLCQ